MVLQESNASPRADRTMPPEQSFTIKTLQYMAWTLAACLLTVTVGTIPDLFDFEPVVILGAMLALTYVGLRLARGQHWAVGGYIPIVVVFAVAVYGSELGSMSTYMVLFYGVAVLLAGALKTVRIAWIVLALSVATHISLTSAETTLDTILTASITIGGCLTGILLINSLFAGELRKAINRAESAARSLASEVEVRQRAETNLLDREQDLRSILNQDSDGIAVTDQSGLILDWNPAMEAFTGIPKTSVLGEAFRDVFGALRHEPDVHTSRMWKETFQRVIDGSEPSGQAVHKTVNIAPSDGSERIADLHMYRVEGPSGVRGVLSVRDVTTQRKLEEERQKSAQLESIGFLAGGLAHEFNNLLMGIRGNISMAKASALDGRADPKLLEQAENACDSAQELATRLLTFAQGGAPIIKTFQAAECVHDAISRAFKDSTKTYDLRIANDLPPIRADKAQLRQALQNVLENAVEVTSAESTVEIDISQVKTNQSDELPLSPGVFVVISVSDRGPGIDEETRSRIFDPYFSTKSDSIGIGLAATHSIMRRHRGGITVDSQAGDGATFKLFVPTATTPDPTTVSSTGGSHRSLRRILVMDDDAAVRDVALMMLEALGYEAVAVSEGREALQAYEEAVNFGAAFDVVIMDLTIKGGLGGVEALRIIRERFPNVTAIVSSGYSSDPVMASFGEYGFKGVIAKPYSKEKLQEVLSELVEER